MTVVERSQCCMFFFFKQKTAYEMRISDWSSDVCSSDLTSAEQPEELVYNIVKVMWNDATRKSLDAGHAKGKLITLENATTGLGIPLHPGAERFYKERSEEHTSELQSLMRISYAVFCLKKKHTNQHKPQRTDILS